MEKGLCFFEFEKAVLNCIDEKYHRRIKKVDELLLMIYGNLRYAHYVWDVSVKRQLEKHIILDISLSYSSDGLVPCDCPHQEIVINLNDGVAMTIQDMKKGKEYFEKYYKTVLML